MCNMLQEKCPKITVFRQLTEPGTGTFAVEDLDVADQNWAARPSLKVSVCDAKVVMCDEFYTRQIQDDLSAGICKLNLTDEHDSLNKI